MLALSWQYRHTFGGLFRSCQRSSTIADQAHHGGSLSGLISDTSGAFEVKTVLEHITPLFPKANAVYIFSDNKRRIDGRIDIGAICFLPRARFRL